jgi:hypothetical protein
MSAFTVLTRLGIEMLEEVLNRSDDRLPDALHDSRVSQRERRRGRPAGDEDHH